RSSAFAREAIELILENLPLCVRRPTLSARAAMCRAAHLAGRAINLTKTTAAHALSYAMTAKFGIPHGHAVALTLGEVLVFNSQICERDTNDARGSAFVQTRIGELIQLL